MARFPSSISSAFFFIYLFLAGAIFSVIETPSDDWLSLMRIGATFGVFVLCILATMIFYEKFPERERSSANLFLFVAFVMAVVIAFMSWPYVLLINAAFGTQESIDVGGRVIAKHEIRGKGNTVSYILDMQPASLEGPLSMSVARETYRRVKVGEHHSRCFYRGGLGLAYRWRYSDTQPYCPRKTGRLPA
ncbi:hypothetical protein ACLBKS_00180 [Hylemonella sp. W303a]|uniref:hypothetical protein n=1 Tax=Hylemonella sp. W303a TaxID=3389873 RepID=UPI00396B416A